MRYFDCTITVRKSQITLKQRLALSDGQVETPDPVTSPLHLDPARRLAVERLHYWLNYTLEKQAQTGGMESPCKQDDLKSIGWLLFDLLLPATDDGDLRGAFREMYVKFVREYENSPEKDLRLRLHLVFDQAAEGFDTLPWEFLYIPELTDANEGFFFAGERTEMVLTRLMPESQLVKNLKPQPEKLRLLIVVVTATDPTTGPVALNEIEGVLKQLNGLEEASRVSVKVLRNPSYDAFAKALEDPDAGPPHVIHYIGHGKEGELALCKDPADPDFDFEREKDPQLRWIEAEQIKALFANHKPRLIFLHACKGAASTSLKSLDSTARKLLAARIPAVVAMQYSISNRDAGMFARSFYESLGGGATLDEAVKVGRLVLGEIYPRRAHPRFGTPVVYLQSREPIVIPLADPALKNAASRVILPVNPPQSGPLNRPSQPAPPAAGSPAAAPPSPASTPPREPAPDGLTD
ncbi:MAG: CHAT domain-containing protein [Verrucomicrobiales bacterium]|nr:CHAT domain-containing protein [Verrucomicrobiales bacterium]